MGMTYFAWDAIRVLKSEDEEGDLRQRQVHGHAVIESVGEPRSGGYLTRLDISAEDE
jgi:hypothetical protein